MAVGAHQVEVELVGVRFGQEVAAAGKVFEIEELVFFDPMHRFHVALIGVRGGRDAYVLAVAQGLGKSALELAAVVGLPDQIAQRDAVAGQMLLDAGGEHGTGGSAALFGEGPEEQATADFPSGVLNQGQVQALGLLPVARDIVKILGIGADLLEQRPLRFDVREILLALIFPPAFFQQAMFAPDALQGVMTDAQIELADEPPRAEGGQGFAEFDQLGFLGGRRFLSLPVRGARLFEQTGSAVLIVATHPLAHRRL